MDFICGLKRNKYQIFILQTSIICLLILKMFLNFPNKCTLLNDCIIKNMMSQKYKACASQSTIKHIAHLFNFDSKLSVKFQYYS